MYSSVAARAVEIATLRAIGFGGTPAFIGTLGRVAGALRRLEASSVPSQPASSSMASSASTLGASFTQVVFSFTLSPALIGQAVLLALAVGLAGGLLPAVRAARMPDRRRLEQLRPQGVTVGRCRNARRLDRARPALAAAAPTSRARVQPAARRARLRRAISVMPLQSRVPTLRRPVQARTRQWRPPRVGPTSPKDWLR